MSRVEIFRGQARRHWSKEDKRRLVAETLEPGATVHAVAQRHGVNTSQLFTWRKRFRADLGLPALEPARVPAFAAVEVATVHGSLEELSETEPRPDTVTPGGVIETHLQHLEPSRGAEGRRFPRVRAGSRPRCSATYDVDFA
jgi:transposase